MPSSSSPTSVPPPYRIVLQPPPGDAIFSTWHPDKHDPNNTNNQACTSPHPTFNDAMQVRLSVFCDEQNCSIPNELDEDDPRSWHWVLYYDSHETTESPPSSATTSTSSASSPNPTTPVAVLRLVPPPHAAHPNGHVDADEEPYVKMGRFATLKECRGKGLGRALFDAALEWASTREAAQEIGQGDWKGMVLLHAQVSVEGMWAKMGFRTDEKLGRWDEEGIAHVGMWRRLDVSR